MMKLWTDPLAPEVMRALPTKCCSVEHIARARSVCKTLDIPFYVLNLEEEFKTQVVDPFLEEYGKGNTPNPCINCNRTIKFGTLLKKMEEFGCEKLATGHYARIHKEADRACIREAVDTRKDQSYYLYGLTQEQLGSILFPLGELEKTEVFALAEKYKVPLYDSYRESQDLCFFPEKEPSAFLKRYLPPSESGPIKTLDGKEVGTHEGLPFYTVGQRRGLKIGGLKIPLYIVRKEQESNTIFVADDGADMQNELVASNCVWHGNIPDQSGEVPLTARVHSLGLKTPGRLTRNGDSLHFRFSKGIRGIAPGQSIVLYDNELVVGGGVITG